MSSHNVFAALTIAFGRAGTVLAFLWGMFAHAAV